MREDLPSGTVTFLFTDVEGSTRLLHSLGAADYADALAEHRALIREACTSHGGVEVDTQGDAFFFAFPEARGGVAAARAFTDALSVGEIQVRVGLHTGTPLVTEEGYVGDDVHFAARVAASGHGGQVVLSSATAELVSLPLVDLGEHRLKDIAEPVVIFQLGAGSFPPLKTIANTNLPTPASSFLGREDDLYAVDALLQDTRLLTIHAPGGQGKTRFAVELARRAREERFSDYPAGVFACFLSSLRDPSLVLPTIAQTLSLKEQPGQSALDALVVHLQGRKLLLLLDNAEHLLAAAPELSSLLERVSGLTLLVTSRELLRISGERAYALPPLTEKEGIVLFCERAHAEPSIEIAELCLRLEGLPLAIELAAARMAILTPAQLVDRLSQRLDLLKGTRDADPRQQTLRATIEWSYELLSDEEQQLFARLSAFQGGCTLEAAEEVTGADLDSLQSLVDKSLLRFTEERYWMLETIREYAAGKVEEAGDVDELREQHATWIAGLLYASRVALRRQDEEAVVWFHTEQNNARAALQWALGRPSADVAHRIYSSAWFPWLTEGGASEGDEFGKAIAQLPAEPSYLYGESLAVAGEFARFRGEPSRAVELKERALAVFELVRDESPDVASARAYTHGDLADALSDLGDFHRAEDHAKRAVGLWREVEVTTEWGFLATEAHAIHAQATVEQRKGNLSSAAALFEDVIARLEAGDVPLEGRQALHALGEVRRRAGDLRGASAALREALSRAELANDRACRAACFASLALLASDEGRLDEAVELFARADVELHAAAVMHDRAMTAAVAESVSACRETLGEERFRVAWARGLTADDDDVPPHSAWSSGK